MVERLHYDLRMPNGKNLRVYTPKFREIVKASSSYAMRKHFERKESNDDYLPFNPFQDLPFGEISFKYNVNPIFLDKIAEKGLEFFLRFYK